jgi:hypothetical protein
MLDTAGKARSLPYAHVHSPCFHARTGIGRGVAKGFLADSGVCCSSISVARGSLQLHHSISSGLAGRSALPSGIICGTGSGLPGVDGGVKGGVFATEMPWRAG